MNARWCIGYRVTSYPNYCSESVTEYNHEISDAPNASEFPGVDVFLLTEAMERVLLLADTFQTHPIPPPSQYQIVLRRNKVSFLPLLLRH